MAAVQPQVILGLSILIATGLLTCYYYIRNRHRSALKLLVDTNIKHDVQLIEKVNLSHNTRRFRFRIPENTCLGLTPGEHINLSAVINGSLVVRTYSPVSTNSDLGFMDLIVKVYFKDANPNFPNGGKMSQFLNNLNLGESVQIRGPAGHMNFNAATAEFAIRENRNSPPRIVRANEINMIAGGSGITPMLQILNAVFTSETSETKRTDTIVSLIYANQTEDDILCRDYIAQIATRFPQRLKVWYTLSQPPLDGWHYGIGRVNKEMFQTHLLAPSCNGIQLLCGPTPMVHSCQAALQDLNYDPARSYVY